MNWLLVLMLIVGVGVVIYVAAAFGGMLSRLEQYADHHQIGEDEHEKHSI